jgi:hypothetical protein
MVMLNTENVAEKSPVTPPPEPLLVFVIVVGAMISVLPLFKVPVFELILKFDIKTFHILISTSS